MNNNTCANCQAEMFGEYCAKCGEQRVTPELRSMRYIVGNIIADLTTLDSKVWKTTLTVLLRPGKLEKDFSLGRRIDYMKPITLFFLINVLFVMFSEASDFYVNFYSQINYQPGYSKILKPFVLEYIANKDIELSKFAEYYDQLVKALARSVIILQVPFFALFSSLIFLRKNYYAGDYFTYSLNAHGWYLMVTLILQATMSAIELLIQLSDVSYDLTPFAFYGVLLMFFPYLALASKRMFDLTWLQTLWRLPLLFIAFALSHQLFRLVQFLITMALVEVE